MTIRIITDSASELTNEESKNLTVLPISVTFGETEYQDGVNLTKREFYEKLIESDELPTTSQVPPFAFSQAIKESLDAKETPIVITMSSKLSGTYNCAQIACAEYGEKVYLIDSLNVCLGQKILVQYALRLIEQGCEAPAIVQKVEEKKSQICVIALLNTLEYLRRGGRISNLSGMVGEVLAIKPVVSVEDGTVVVLGKARGSRKGNNLLTEQISKHGGIDFSLPVALGYSGLDDTLLQKYIADHADDWQEYIDHLPIDIIGFTIGTHVGPGGIAVAFFHK